MASSSSDVKNLFEIKKFNGTGFDLWKDKIQGILFLKDCEGTLEQVKPQDMSDEAWVRQNRKKTTPINQVHLMRKLVGMQLDESKSAGEHLSLFTGILSQLQDSGLPSFDDKLKAIFLLMTLPDSWETLVVSLSNNPNLTFDGVRGSILNEEIRRKASGEGGSSANMVRDRTEKKNAYAQRSKRSLEETVANPNARSESEFASPEVQVANCYELLCPAPALSPMSYSTASMKTPSCQFAAAGSFA
ncbi:hypothetical protein L7F22_062833 [Adiantum nelumboides]|nr:hypothetical protein [Adiantum nelumboides]